MEKVDGIFELQKQKQELEKIFKGSRIYEETALNIMYMTNRKMIKVGGL